MPEIVLCPVLAYWMEALKVFHYHKIVVVHGISIALQCLHAVDGCWSNNRSRIPSFSLVYVSQVDVILKG